MAALKNRCGVLGALAIILILGPCVTTRGVEFAGGTGEPNDPYQIATAEQLIGISSDPNLFDRHFVLTADIDLDPSLPGRKVFHGPVVELFNGRAGSSLRGSFDGDGHVIRNCVLLNTRETSYAGFFSEISSQAIVQDLHLENMVLMNGSSTVSTGNHPGLLAAINRGTVVNCSVTGTLTTYAGGSLLGQNAGLVAGCRASCDVFGSSVGGLIGRNEAAGRVILCESDGTLFSDSLSGGLVGTNAGTIQYCRSTGFMSASQAGGLVGLNDGLIRECYVIATLESGGGVAYKNVGTIVNCYATGLLLNAYSDGLVRDNAGAILSSHSTTPTQVKPAMTGRRRSPGWDAPTGGEDPAVSVLAQRIVQYVYYLNSAKTADQITDPLSGYGVPLSSEQMTQAPSFVGFDFHGDANDGPAGHWFMPSDGYPVLTWQTDITGLTAVPDVSGLSPEQAKMVLESAGFEPNGVGYDYARVDAPQVNTKGQVIAARPIGYLPPGSPVSIMVSLGEYDFRTNPGNGSEERPYQIETAGQLDAFFSQSALWDKHFDLTADIDLSGYSYSTSLILDFLGEFNGNGHTIRNWQSPRGLFGEIESEASVHDLVIVDAWTLSVPTDPTSILPPASSQIGILACNNMGQVSRCSVSGWIDGSVGIGGLVGYNTGQLTDCRFSGRIRGYSYVGGLAGMNAGEILRCCARDVEISGDNRVGGLAGESATGTLIEACYATGKVQGADSVGGLVGQHGTPPAPRRRSVSTQESIAITGDPMTDAVIRDCYAACLVTGSEHVGGCIGSAASGTARDSCFFLAPEDDGGPDNGLGMSLTDSQMKQQMSFTDWDFEDTWTICEGRDYPRLRWEETECSE